VLRELASDGAQDVLVIPLSFVSDHIETLYEVDVLFAGVARWAGITGYHRTPALNDSPLFISALARLVRSHLVPGHRSCGTCRRADSTTCVHTPREPLVPA
jgi:ferrochelatase